MLSALLLVALVAAVGSGDAGVGVCPSGFPGSDSNPGLVELRRKALDSEAALKTANGFPPAPAALAAAKARARYAKALRESGPTSATNAATEELKARRFLYDALANTDATRGMGSMCASPEHREVCELCGVKPVAPRPVAALPPGAAEIGTGVTTFRRGPYPGADIGLWGPLSKSCDGWTKDFEARELARAADLGVSEADLSSWARERAKQVRPLCTRFTIVEPARLPTDRPVTDAELNLPSGYLSAIGLVDSDFATFRKAAKVSPFSIVPVGSAIAASLRNSEACAAEFGAVETDGRWSWCKPDLDPGNPDRRFWRLAIRIGVIVMTIGAAVGLIALFVISSRRRGRGRPLHL